MPQEREWERIKAERKHADLWQFKMKRNPRKLKWTKAFRKAANKEMVVDSTLLFAARRNVPVRYNRELATKTLAAMDRIAEIRARRERLFYKQRMSGNRVRKLRAARKLVEQHSHLLQELPKRPIHHKTKQAEKEEALEELEELEEEEEGQKTGLKTRTKTRTLQRFTDDDDVVLEDSLVEVSGWRAATRTTRTRTRTTTTRRTPWRWTERVCLSLCIHFRPAEERKRDTGAFAAYHTLCVFIYCLQVTEHSSA